MSWELKDVVNIIANLIFHFIQKNKINNYKDK